MLSAFILGLAFGGLWVRRRIDRIADPRALPRLVQVAMGVAGARHAAPLRPDSS